MIHPNSFLSEDRPKICVSDLKFFEQFYHLKNKKFGLFVQLSIFQIDFICIDNALWEVFVMEFLFELLRIIGLIIKFDGDI